MRWTGWRGVDLSSCKIPEFTTQLADLRGYFLYLTLDSLEDRKLARGLVKSFEGLEVRAELHSKALLHSQAATLGKARDSKVTGGRVQGVRVQLQTNCSPAQVVRIRSEYCR